MNREGTCYHCGLPLSGDCITLTTLQGQEEYHLHPGCCRNVVTPLKNPAESHSRQDS